MMKLKAGEEWLLIQLANLPDGLFIPDARPENLNINTLQSLAMIAGRPDVRKDIPGIVWTVTSEGLRLLTALVYP